MTMLARLDGVVPAPAFRPPAISPALAAVLNRAAGRATVSIPVNGRPVGLRICLPAPADPAGIRLAWTFGEEHQVAFVPEALAQALLLPGAGAPDPDLAALLLEAMLDAPLAWLEAASARPVRIAAPTAMPPLDGPPPQLAMEVEHGRARFSVGLNLGPLALDALAGLLDRAPRVRNAVGALPVQVCLRIGLTELTLQEVMALRPGDAILLQETGLLDGRVAVIAGEHLMAAARLIDTGAALETSFRPAAGTPVGRWCVENGFEDPVEDDVRALRVTLVFELGRRLASLAEIESLGIGSIVETGSGPDGMVDVLANGRRIGRGRIVQVGGALAIQLERINHGADP